MCFEHLQSGKVHECCTHITRRKDWQNSLRRKPLKALSQGLFWLLGIVGQCYLTRIFWPSTILMPRCKPPNR